MKARYKELAMMTPSLTIETAHTAFLSWCREHSYPLWQGDDIIRDIRPTLAIDILLNQLKEDNETSHNNT